MSPPPTTSLARDFAESRILDLQARNESLLGEVLELQRVRGDLITRVEAGERRVRESRRILVEAELDLIRLVLLAESHDPDSKRALHVAAREARGRIERRGGPLAADAPSHLPSTLPSAMHGRAAEYLNGWLGTDEPLFLDHLVGCAECQAHLHAEVQVRDREDAARDREHPAHGGER